MCAKVEICLVGAGSRKNAASKLSALNKCYIKRSRIKC